jgi:hypothetical protein
MATNARVFESDDDSDTESIASRSSSTRGEGKYYDDFTVYNEIIVLDKVITSASAAEKAILSEKIWSKVGILRATADGKNHDNIDLDFMNILIKLI